MVSSSSPTGGLARCTLGPGSVREHFFLLYEIKSEDRKISGLGLGFGLPCYCWDTLLLLGLLPARAPMRLLATRLAG